MSGPVKNRVGTNVRGNECPGFNKGNKLSASDLSSNCTLALGKTISFVCSYFTGI